MRALGQIVMVRIFSSALPSLWAMGSNPALFKTIVKELLARNQTLNLKQ